MNFTGKKLFLVGVILLLLVTIPLTLYFVKQQQDLRSSAAPSSTISLTAENQNVKVGETFSVDVMLDPGANIPSFIKLTLQYDPRKLKIVQINPDSQNISTTLSGPIYEEGSTSVEFGINKIIETGYNPSGDLSDPFKVASIDIEALEKTEPSTQIGFDFPGSTQVLSISVDDGPGENVLINALPITISVLDEGSSVPTPTTPATSVTPTPLRQPIASPSPTLTPTPTEIPKVPPVCSSLQISPASGPAPLITQLTALGNDTDGQITKVTFNFGDGQVVDVTEGVGSLSAQIEQSHTYTTANTFNVSVIFTDNDGLTSTACTQTVEVSAGTGDSTPSAQTPVEPTPMPTLAPPGSVGTVLGVGGAVILTIVGGFLLFLL